MDALAIRPTLFDMCRKIAAWGYFVLLPDMFYRAGPYEPVDAQAIFATGDVVAALGKLMASTDAEKAASDCEALLAYLAEHPHVRGAKVGAIGYCMGGATALIAAALHPERIACAASFHGGFLTNDSEFSPHRLAARMRGRVYVGAAENDPHFTREDEAKLSTALAKANVDHLIETYVGAAHGWTMADLPVYSPAAAEKHWQRLFELLDQTLKPHAS
jgi:carboxymethylenebutenolidase